MAAVLNTNMASLYAQKNLSTAQTSLAESVQRLSSGTRINSAKDDAAGYGISQSITGTKNVVDQNIRNAQNGISWAQTAEGALDVVGKILQRALTLTTQARDGSLNNAQYLSISNELTALRNEINNITVRTKFQGGTSQASVFGATEITGTPPAADALTRTLTVDTGSGSSTSVVATMIATTDLNTVITRISGGSPAGQSSIAANVTAIQDLINTNATNRSNLGEKINALEYAVDNMQTLSNNLSDGISRIVDTDYAKETANLTRTQILQQAATAMLTQANQMPNVILTLLK